MWLCYYGSTELRVCECLSSNDIFTKSVYNRNVSSAIKRIHVLRGEQNGRCMC